MYCGGIIAWPYLCHNGTVTTKGRPFQEYPIEMQIIKLWCLFEDDGGRGPEQGYTCGHYYVFIYLFCLHDCMCAHRHALDCHSICAEVRKQLVQSILSVYHVGPCDELRSLDLAGQALFPTKPSYRPQDLGMITNPANTSA